MASIGGIEQRYIESLFGMEGGYVLDFSDRTFGDFFVDELGIDIHDDKYRAKGSSKANKFRQFLSIEENHVIAHALGALLDYVRDLWVRNNAPVSDTQRISFEKVQLLVERLRENASILDIKAIVPDMTDRTMIQAFDSVKAAIDRGEPESGIDHLHTFLFQFVRKLCEKKNIEYSVSESLNAVFGKYIRNLDAEGRLESEMSLIIMKSSISLLDRFNGVRNDLSLAHPNPVIHRQEAIFIFNNITSLVRFVRHIESI